MPVQDGIFGVSPDDYSRIVEVWEESVRATHHFVKESDIDIFRPLVGEELPNIDLDCVRDENGLVVGFIGVSKGKIEMLFIHPEWRGQGIGRRLVQYTVDERQATTLDVNEQNDQALGFYLRLGFKVEDRSEFDGLGKPYPLLHMRLAASQ